MKIAFISDIHSNKHAFLKVIDKINNIDVDEILCVGDIVGYNAFPHECIELIKRNNTKSVMGNHDLATIDGKTSWFNKLGLNGINYSINHITEDDFYFLNQLPYSRLLRKDGYSFYLAHGSPRDNLFEYVYPHMSDKKLEHLSKNIDTDFIVLGHTHIPMDLSIGNKSFLNPGSVGQPRDGNPKASFMIFDSAKRRVDWYRVNYDIKKAAKAIIEAGLPKKSAERLFVGR